MVLKGSAGAAVALAWSLASAAYAAPPRVEVVGLFRDQAVVRFAGAEHLLRKGQSVAGLTLITADSSKAVFRYRGERFELGLSGRVGASFAAVEQTTFSIMRDEFGQYRTGGAINGQPVDLLVDTGASIMVMSRTRADRLGLQIDPDGPQVTVYTAQGETPAHVVVLDRVTVGGIERRGVQAAVIEGDYPAEILLGMSFLSGVTLQESAGVLTLTQHF